MEPHDIAARVMQDQVQKVEAQNGVKAGGEIAEQFGEIAVLQNGLGNVEE